MKPIEQNGGETPPRAGQGYPEKSWRDGKRVRGNRATGILGLFHGLKF